MKLRVSVVGYLDGVRQRERDATLTVDVTATVGEIARALVRAGAGRKELFAYAVHRHGQLTLLVRHPDGTSLVLDAGDPIGAAGLLSGSRIEPIRESDAGAVPRTRMPSAYVTVLAGEQQHLQFLAVPGETTIGRDRTNRIELHEKGVSRKHAVIRSTRDGIEVEDLGSANGTAPLGVDGQRREMPGRVIPVRTSTVIEIGTVPIKIDPGPPISREAPRESSLLHLQAPVVDPVYAPEPVELPTPPDETDANRFPLIAMMAPFVMGVVLYLTTKSVLSLIFIGLSPIIMIGSWFDNCLTRRKQLKQQQAEFEESLAQAEQELAQGRELEQRARAAETPPPAELMTLPTSREVRLWSRRPEHRAFLELRLGTATLPSRTAIELPPRASIPAEKWFRLHTIFDRYRSVPEVPVLERLDRSGAIGIAGPAFWAGEAARALLVQVLSLHSPADVVFTAFASNSQARDEWAWLKWLPHVDSAYSPVEAAHLAADPRAAMALLTSLEAVILQRAASANTSTVRSRLDGSAADAKERLTPASEQRNSPTIIVLVLDDRIVDRTRLVGLAEDGADVGVHIIWLGAHLGRIPAACRTVLEANEHTWRAHFVREGEIIPITTFDTIGAPLAEQFGRSLAPLVDAGARVLDESDLPRSVPLAQLTSGDILGSGEAILRNWQLTDSLTAGWRPGAERDAGQLTATIGQGSTGTVDIDLRMHGPHALIGGTTGSGKSDFLNSWIYSLAARYSPDRLTFLFVDYKGGSAFGECLDLPHTVGLVTDLNTHLVRRALTSLRAELRYREELFAQKGAKDLIALERRSDPDAPPVLLIVVDEFAALVNEIPEFVDGMIDIAQRGRSLGLHLILATQRPQGVIKDNLRANTNLRVCLRMADASDSVDVIGVPDAAYFPPDTQGRAALKVGAGRLTHFQTGYLGGRSDSDHQEPVEIRDLEFGEQQPWQLAPEQVRAQKKGQRGPTDLQLVSRNIQAAAKTAQITPPRKPWLDQLPTFLPLDSPLLTLPATPEATPASDSTAEGLSLTLGLIDEPEKQQQNSYTVAPGEVGSLVVYGGAGSGKTSTLITAAVAAIQTAPDTIVYGIDSGGGRLGSLDALPNTGDTVRHDERDRVVRLLALVKDIVQTRTQTPAPEPTVLLLIDGFAAFRDTYEHLGGGATPFEDLIDIARGGRTVGVHVLLTSERAIGLPSALAASVPERLVLRLPAENDYSVLGVATGVLDDASPGRALRIGEDAELQIALPGEGTEPEDTDAAIAELASRQQGMPKPPGVPAIPETLSRAEIARTASGPVFAIDTMHLAAVTAPASGFLLVTGPAGSGRTTTVRSLLEAFAEQSAAQTTIQSAEQTPVQPVDAVLISPRRSTLRDLAIWSDVADTPDTREAVIARLTRALGGKSPSTVSALPTIPLIGTSPESTTHLAESSAAEPVAEAIPFPAEGRRGVVVIEDIGGFDGSGSEQALATLLKLLRRSEHTTLVEGENATLGTVWELAAPLRGARWAIALQPDANDAPSVFTTPFTHARRAEFPPGRGFLVRGGIITGIHVALPDHTL